MALKPSMAKLDITAVIYVVTWGVVILITVPHPAERLPSVPQLVASRVRHMLDYPWLKDNSNIESKAMTKTLKIYLVITYFDCTKSKNIR